MAVTCLPRSWQRGARLWRFGAALAAAAFVLLYTRDLGTLSGEASYSLSGRPMQRHGLLHMHLGVGHRCLLLTQQGSARLPKMNALDVSSCGLASLPHHFPWEQLLNLVELDLSDNMLKVLPLEMGAMRKLRCLHLGSNEFSIFPGVVRSFASLEVLSLDRNQLVSIGEQDLPRSLLQLSLSSNQLTTLPAAVPRLQLLRRLEISGNQLSDLPQQLEGLVNLEDLAVAGNQLRGLPLQVFALPRLSWLTVAANRWPASENFTAVRADPLGTRVVAATSIHLAPLKGVAVTRRVHAVSNHIPHRGALVFNATIDDVSLGVGHRETGLLLKVWLQPPTALAHPAEEAQLHGVLGSHPNIEGIGGIIEVKNASETVKSGDGEVGQSQLGQAGGETGFHDPDGHPLHHQALLLQRPPGLRHLAAAPNGTVGRPLHTKYPRRRRYAMGFILRVGRGVCHALAHMHAHEVSHGTLPAHASRKTR